MMAALSSFAVLRILTGCAANLGWFWLDEAAQMHEDVWRVMIGRLRKRPARGWLTTTPNPDRRDWVYDLFSRDTTGLITASTRSNPHLPAGFVDDSRHAIQQSGVSVRLRASFTIPMAA
jgi:hypothetical protein